MTCATPHCSHRANAGRFTLFCKPCAKRLAGIRERFEAETFAHDPRSGWQKKRGPICCTVGCGEPRPQGESYCAVCRAMDVEGEAA